MEIPSRLKDVKIMRIKAKNLPLDQTGGPREEELEKNLSQLVHQRKTSKSNGKSKEGIIGIKKLTIIEWHNYKHLEWITVRIDDDKFFGCFIANVFKKQCHQKACRRSSIVDQKLPKEAQPHKARYNKDKKNRLMRIDELHKFSDGTLNDVRSALDDTLKRIWMKYPP
ncbi:hypothetical protein Tco_1303932 [Tanacetum coccineum]